MKAPFIPIKTKDFFDDSFLESFSIFTKLKEDIAFQAQNLKNPNVPTYFGNFYFDKDKDKEEILKNNIITMSKANNISSKKGFI